MSSAGPSSSNRRERHRTNDVIVAIDHWSLLGASLSSVSYDYEDEPDEDEEPQDGPRADDS
jgi:hypothetical protein